MADLQPGGSPGSEPWLAHNWRGGHDWSSRVQKRYVAAEGKLSVMLTAGPGGLLIDHGVLTLKPNSLPLDSKSGLPRVPPSHPAIVEWRAMTVIEL